MIDISLKSGSVVWPRVIQPWGGKSRREILASESVFFLLLLLLSRAAMVWFNCSKKKKSARDETNKLSAESVI